MKQLKKRLKTLKNDFILAINKQHDYDKKLTFYIGLFIIAATFYIVRDMKQDFVRKCLEEGNTIEYCEV